MEPLSQVTIKFKDGSTYRGPATAQGQPMGKGQMTDKQGIIYEGTFHIDGLEGTVLVRIPERSGECQATLCFRGGIPDLTQEARLVSPDGTQYFGCVDNGFRRNGPGRCEFPNTHPIVRCSGQFIADKLTGNGRIDYRDGGVYEGLLRDGLPHGEGKWTRGQDTLQGEWINGKLFRVTNSSMGRQAASYHGEMSQGLPQGHGVFRDGRGACYTGGFESGKRHGDGTFENQTCRYQGRWEKDMLEGTGTLQLLKENLVVDQADFSNNMLNGQANVKLATGDVLSGYFEDNQKHGHFTFHHAKTGKTITTEFRRDVEVTPKTELMQQRV